MARGIRYTPEQKREMKKQALQLRAGGKTQQAVAKSLGIAVMTLRNLMGDADKPRRAKKAPTTRKKAAVRRPSSDSALNLALKKQRLEKIERQRADLAKAAAKLQAEMKSLYGQLGVEIFGAKQATKKALRRPRRRAKSKKK